MRLLIVLILAIVILMCPHVVFCEQEYHSTKVTITYDTGKKEVKNVEIEGTPYAFSKNLIIIRILDPNGKPIKGLTVEVKRYPGYTGGGVSFSPTDVLKGTSGADGSVSLHLTPDKGGVVELYVDGVRVRPPLWIRYQYLPLSTLAFVIVVGVALFLMVAYLAYRVIRGPK